MNKGIKTFNFIRENSTEAFVETVPSATEDNIASIRNILFNDAYQPMLNEFVTNLINRIALTIISNKSYSNPLAMFKKGSVPLGTDIQDIFTNPAEAEEYEYSNTAMAKVLTITDPDTKVAYYRRNRRDLYTKTISREGLRGAFVSWEKFEDFISSITQSLYSGNYIDEFEYTKQLIDGAYDNNKVIVETVTAPTNESTAKAFLKTVRSLYNKLSFPSTNYNAYSKFNPTDKPVKTWTEPDRVVLIITADALASLDVDALASAFNIDKANFMGRVITVDKFENDEIVGVICDESWLQIYDNLFRFDEQYNARVMAWNEYLHAWGTYAISPFANAVVLATAQPKPATAIEMGSNVSLDLNDDENGKTVNVTLTPSDATTEVTYTSSNEDVVTVEKVTEKQFKVYPKAVGSVVVTGRTDNGLTDKITVTVSDKTVLENIIIPSGITVADNGEITVTITLDPTTAENVITYSSTDETVFTATKVSNTSVTIAGVGAGVASLVATSDNGKTSSAVVTVTD